MNGVGYLVETSSSIYWKWVEVRREYSSNVQEELTIGGRRYREHVEALVTSGNFLNNRYATNNHVDGVGPVAIAERRGRGVVLRSPKVFGS